MRFEFPYLRAFACFQKKMVVAVVAAAKISKNVIITFGFICFFTFGQVFGFSYPFFPKREAVQPCRNRDRLEEFEKGAQPPAMDPGRNSNRVQAESH
jgi:hypothetical protein